MKILIEEKELTNIFVKNFEKELEEFEKPSKEREEKLNPLIGIVMQIMALKVLHQSLEEIKENKVAQ